MGYIIVGEGGTAGIVGKAIAIPYDKPELAAAHALAGQYFGMRFIYLEGGSGVANPVPPEMIKSVKKFLTFHSSSVAVSEPKNKQPQHQQAQT